MNALLIIEALSLGVSCAAAFVIAAVLIREPGRLGAGWRYILAALLCYAASMLARIMPTLGVPLPIAELPDALEVAYMTLFALGIGVKLAATRAAGREANA